MYDAKEKQSEMEIQYTWKHDDTGKNEPRETFNILCRLLASASAFSAVTSLQPRPKVDEEDLKDAENNVNWILKKIFLMKEI